MNSQAPAAAYPFAPYDRAGVSGQRGQALVLRCVIRLLPITFTCLCTRRALPIASQACEPAQAPPPAVRRRAGAGHTKALQPGELAGCCQTHCGTTPAAGACARHRGFWSERQSSCVHIAARQ